VSRSCRRATGVLPGWQAPTTNGIVRPRLGRRRLRRPLNTPGGTQGGQLELHAPRVRLPTRTRPMTRASSRCRTTRLPVRGRMVADVRSQAVGSAGSPSFLHAPAAERKAPVANARTSGVGPLPDRCRRVGALRPTASFVPAPPRRSRRRVFLLEYAPATGGDGRGVKRRRKATPAPRSAGVADLGSVLRRCPDRSAGHRRAAAQAAIRQERTT
jgi:hypothetical protein